MPAPASHSPEKIEQAPEAPALPPFDPPPGTTGFFPKAAKSRLHSREAVQKALDLYRRTVPIKDICAQTGLGVGTLYHHVDHAYGDFGMGRRRNVEGQALVGVDQRGRRRLAARLWRTAEKHVREVEYRLMSGMLDIKGQQRDLVLLGQLSRLLRDLAMFEDAGVSAAIKRRKAEAGRDVEEALALEGRAVYIRRSKEP